MSFRLLSLVVLALVTAAACGQPQGGTASPSSAAAGASGPVITSFHLITEVSCTGAQANVPASWTTRAAKSVSFQVDDKPVPAGAGHPVNGKGSVPVPCDGKEHKVVLVASGEGTTAALAHHVNTMNTPPPPPDKPSITTFQILAVVTCEATPMIEVPASWTTQNVTTISFSVDGVALPAAAGFPPNGSGNIPVPCDGKDHKVTLNAGSTGGDVTLSRSVNTVKP